MLNEIYNINIKTSFHYKFKTFDPHPLAVEFKVINKTVFAAFQIPNCSFNLKANVRPQLSS